MSYYEAWFNTEVERSKKERKNKWETEKYTFIKGCIILFVLVGVVGLGVFETFPDSLNKLLIFFHIPYMITEEDLEGIKAAKLLIPLFPIYCFLFYFFSGARAMGKPYLKNIQKEVISELENESIKETFAKEMMDAKNGVHPIVSFQKDNQYYEYICTENFIFAKENDSIKIIDLSKVDCLRTTTENYGNNFNDHELIFQSKKENERIQLYHRLSFKSQQIRDELVQMILHCHPQLEVIDGLAEKLAYESTLKGKMMKILYYIFIGVVLGILCYIWYKMD